MKKKCDFVNDVILAPKPKAVLEFERSRHLLCATASAFKKSHDVVIKYNKE